MHVTNESEQSVLSSITVHLEWCFDIKAADRIDFWQIGRLA
jgi:hypothetical protein